MFVALVVSLAVIFFLSHFAAFSSKRVAGMNVYFVFVNLYVLKNRKLSQKKLVMNDIDQVA